MMHTYAPATGGTWDVFITLIEHTHIVRSFPTESEAAMFAHYLNGGEVDRLMLRRWFTGSE